MRKIIIVLIGILTLSGCVSSSKYMRVMDNPNIGSDSSKAYVVIFRPDIYVGSAIQSSVYDVTGEETAFIGILPSGNKLVYETDPGKKLLMVVSENADFLKADLQAGKTYYAKIDTGEGLWKARFYLKAVSEEELTNPKFKQAMDSCRYLQNTEDSLKWAKDNEMSIEKKRKKYYAKWIKKNESSKNPKPILK